MIGGKAAEKILEGLRSDRSVAVLAELSNAFNPLTFDLVREAVLLNGTVPDGIPRDRIRGLDPLKDLTALESLDLIGTQVSDLAPLQGLTALQSLVLSYTQVSDITPLQGSTALRSLDLAGTQVSDITPLQGLTALQSLDLRNTQVSDITPLKGLTGLRVSFSVRKPAAALR